MSKIATTTEYDLIFESGRKRFSDYNFLAYDDLTKDEIMLGHLQSAISDFEDACQYDLSSRDDDAKLFNVSLKTKEIEILGLGIAYYWCSVQSLSSDLFKNIPNTKDYGYSSPATLLTSIHTLRDSLKREFRREIINYGYSHGDISGLKV